MPDGEPMLPLATPTPRTSPLPTPRPLLNCTPGAPKLGAFWEKDPLCTIVPLTPPPGPILCRLGPPELLYSGRPIPTVCCTTDRPAVLMLLPVVPPLLPLRHPPRPLPPPPPRPVLCIVPDVERVRVLLLECLVAKLAHRQLPLVFSRSQDTLLQQPLFVRSSFPALVNTENLSCTQAVLKNRQGP